MNEYDVLFINSGTRGLGDLNYNSMDEDNAFVSNPQIAENLYSFTSKGHSLVLGLYLRFGRSYHRCNSLLMDNCDAKMVLGYRSVWCVDKRCCSGDGRFVAAAAGYRCGNPSV